MKNPFTPAEKVQKKLKVLLFGPSGSGKTLAALSFPRPAVIDSEGGTDLYAGREGIPPFQVLRAKSITELENAVKFIKYDNGKTFETLIIDPITVFYDVLKQGTERQAKNQQMGFREWAKINSRMKYLYNELTNLPVHVVVLARESIEYATKNGSLERTGVKPDADKALVYIFDFVIQMTPDHRGIVKKSRGIDLGKNGTLETVDWSTFQPIAEPYIEGDTITSESEDTAADRDATDLGNRDVAEGFARTWKDQGLSANDIMTALGVAKLSDWTAGLDAANVAVETYLLPVVDEPTKSEKKPASPKQSKSRYPTSKDNITEFKQSEPPTGTEG